MVKKWDFEDEKKILNVNFISYSTLLSGLMAIIPARNMSKSMITNKNDI